MKENLNAYYAVIFSSKHSENTAGYADMAQKMELLAKQQKGYLGIESARNSNSAAPNAGLGITISYWESLDAIKNWKNQTDHLFAQQKGKSDWYSWYKVRICKIEREYEFYKP